MNDIATGVVAGVCGSIFAFCFVLNILRCMKATKRVEIKESRSDLDLAALNRMATELA
jgi:hypothetical protein